MSLVEKGPTECGVFGCDREASTVKRPCPIRGCRAMEKQIVTCSAHLLELMKTLSTRC
jgi:hypothetical protein